MQSLARNAALSNSEIPAGITPIDNGFSRVEKI
jgi:hypothetical protein